MDNLQRKNTKVKHVKIINLPLFIRKNSLYRKLVASKRIERNPTVKKKRVVLSFKKIKVLLVLLLLFFFLFTFFNIYKYLNFNPQPINSELKINDSNKNITILFIGLDDRVKEYSFADLLVLMDIDQNKNIAKLYTINPLYLSGTNTGYNLRTEWNANKTDPAKYLEVIGNLLAIKVDNYIVFNKSSAEDTISDFNNSFAVNETYSLDNKTIDRGNRILLTEALDLSVGNPKKNRDLLSFQQLFLKSLLQSIGNKVNLYKTFINPELFLSTFKSGLPKNEFITLLLNLGDLDIVTSQNYIMSDNLGTLSINDPDIIKPNFSLLDENITNNFRLFDVIKEQSQIEIYNGTNEPGLATKYKRLLQNRGGNIIKIGNYSEIVENTKIYMNLKDLLIHRSTINLIYDVLGSGGKILDISEYKYNYSGDLVIVFGKDIIH